MIVDAAKIAQMELALDQAKAEFQRQNGKKFEILWTWLSEAEKERFHDSLITKQDRVLFGLDAPETSGRPAKSGGNFSCPLCDKTGLTKRGLALHMVRMHRGVDVNKALSEEAMAEIEGGGQNRRGERSTGDMFEPVQAGASRRRGSRLQDTAEESEE